VVFAKRSLSQNFLIDHNIRRKLVEELGSEPGDAVLEIGPGHGELSDLLAGRVSRLVLVEKDDRLATDLARRYVDRLDIQVVHGDALQADLSALLGDDRPGRLICNVPYGITSPLIFRFLEIRPFPHRMVLLVQREVAERLAAAPGTRTYGALSVGVQIRARVRVAFGVGRRAFRPVPRVDSCAVVIERVGVAPAAADLEKLRIMTRVCFSRRRKQIGTILRTAPEFRLPRERLPEILGREGIDPKARPETLSPTQFLALARRLERF
jgi:16S rRNA (adenine1518-N6/adenine1519-N6)-dimethyltransferase